MSSFVRNLVVLGIFSLLTGFTVMTASAYIFIFRLSVLIPSRTTSTTVEIQSKVIHQTAIIFDTTTIKSSFFEPVPVNGSYSMLNEFEPSNSTMDDGNNGTLSIGHNQTVGLGFEFGNNTVYNSTHASNGKPLKNPLNFAAIAKSWEEFRTTWRNSKSYVLSSSAVAFFASFFQFLSAALIVFFGRLKSNDSLLRKIAFRWIAINCVTALILVAVIVSNESMNSDPEKASGNPNYVSELEYSRERHIFYDLSPITIPATGTGTGTGSSPTNSTPSDNNSSMSLINNGSRANSTDYLTSFHAINTFVAKYIVANFYNFIIAMDVAFLFIIILCCSFTLRFYKSPSYNNVFLVK